MNNLYDNVKVEKESILEIDDDDKSISTTDSDRLEFLKLIKKRKLEKKMKRHSMIEDVSSKKTKNHYSNIISSVNGTISEASQVSTTFTHAGRAFDIKEPLG